MPWREVDRDTFFRTRESGGTMISSAYKLCAKMIDDEFPPSEWNIYPFQFSDGDNWSADDTSTCMEVLKKDILPKVNLFCYGQVESPYGSGSSSRTCARPSRRPQRGHDRNRKQGRHRGCHPRLSRER
jgi:uncharacterized sporulation protein YeaH/YhbH (DUF444 family)